MVGTASTTSVVVGENRTKGTISGVALGTFNIIQRSLIASLTGDVGCTGVTGITTSPKVFVSVTSTLAGGVANEFGGFSIQAASTTASSVIGVQISPEITEHHLVHVTSWSLDRRE